MQKRTDHHTEGPQKKANVDHTEVEGGRSSKLPRTGDAVRTGALASSSGLNKITRRLEALCPFETQVAKDLDKLAVYVVEIYSRPRATVRAPKWGVRAGEAIDLTTGWDFTRAEDRQMASRYLDEQESMLLIGSPMCTMFCRLQNLSPWNEVNEELWCEAIEHMEFVVRLYEKQRAEGRWFLHEHPAQATSWVLTAVEQLREKGGCYAKTGRPVSVRPQDSWKAWTPHPC